MFPSLSNPHTHGMHTSPLPSPCEQDTSLLLGQPRRFLVCLQGTLAQSHPCSVPVRTGRGGGSPEHRCRLHVELLGNGRLRVTGRRQLGSTCIHVSQRHGATRVSSEKGEETAFPKGRERRCWVRQLSWLHLKKSRKQSHLTPCHHQRLKGTQPECEGHCHRQTLLPQLSPHIRCPPLTPSKDSTPFLLTQISKKSATRN